MSDAVAEAFTQALRRGDAIRSPERWLWRTIFLIAAAELKQRGRGNPEPMEATYEMSDLARGSTAPAVHVHLTRGRKRLRELLETDDA